MTADYRKMLGIQSIDEKKDRSKHSHHAIDATTLTLIPGSNTRDKMLKLFYQIEEGEKFHHNVDEQRRQLSDEIKNLDFSNAADIGKFIESNILVNHISNDRTFTPAKRRVRARGKVQLVTDKFGNVKDKWTNGNSVRAQLHKDTIFGAIKYPEKDEQGNPKVENGAFVYPESKNFGDNLSMVVRVPITSFTDIKDLDVVVDANTRNRLKSVIQSRLDAGMSAKAAFNEPIYFTRGNGSEIKTDKNGRPLSPVRHVRCMVKAGRGFMTFDKSIPVKKHTYLSSKDYKQSFYMQNDGNYLYLLYEGINKKGKIERASRIVSYFEAVELGIKSPNDIKSIPHYATVDKGKARLHISKIFIVGTRILMWENSPEELFSMNNSELNKRLFVVFKFNNMGSDFVFANNHLEARPDKEAEKGQKTEYNSSKYITRVKLSPSNLNCLVENQDFVIDKLGNIHFNHTQL